MRPRGAESNREMAMNLYRLGMKCDVIDRCYGATRASKWSFRQGFDILHRKGSIAARLSIVAAALACSVFAQQSRTGWKEYLGGPDSSHYSPLKQITTSNVNKLE